MTDFVRFDPNEVEGFCRTDDLRGTCYKYLWTIKGFSKELKGPHTLQSAYERSSDVWDDHFRSGEFEIYCDGHISRWRLLLYVDSKGWMPEAEPKRSQDIVYHEPEALRRLAASSADRRRKQRSPMESDSALVDTVSIYLENLDNKPVSASLRLSIIDSESMQRWGGELQRPNLFNSSTLRKDLGWDIISHSALLKDPSLLPSGTLIILSEVIPTTGSPATAHIKSYREPITSGTHDILQFYPRISPQQLVSLDFNSPRRGEHAPDITITCEGRKFFCHKAFLAAWSPYWEQRFKDPTRGERQYEESGIDPEVVEGALKYLYAGELPAAHLARPMLEYASLRKLERLRLHQEKRMLASLCSTQSDSEKDFCIDCLHVGLTTKSKELVEKAVRNILINLRSFCESEERKSRLRWVYEDISRVYLNVTNRWAGHIPTNNVYHKPMMKTVREYLTFPGSEDNMYDNEGSEVETAEDTTEGGDDAVNNLPEPLQAVTKDHPAVKRRKEPGGELEDNEYLEVQVADEILMKLDRSSAVEDIVKDLLVPQPPIVVNTPVSKRRKLK